MNTRKRLLGLRCITARHGGFVPLAAGAQARVAAPAVRAYCAAGLDGLEDECLQAGRRRIGHTLQADAPDPGSVLLFRDRD